MSTTYTPQQIREGRERLIAHWKQTGQRLERENSFRNRIKGFKYQPTPIVPKDYNL